MAIKPFVRIFANSETGVRFVTPCFVVKIKYASSSNDAIGIIAVTCSSFSIPNKLIIGSPFAVRPYSGISYPLAR